MKHYNRGIGQTHWLAALVVPVVAIYALPAAQGAFSPVADPGAVVRCNANTRITVLSPRVFRAEVSRDGVFEDRGTLTFPNRRVPVPAFDVVNGSSDGWCNITVYSTSAKTGEPTLRVAIDSSSISIDWDQSHADPFQQMGLRASGLGGWSWAAGDAVNRERNLNGTLAPTPSADLAGCCVECKNAWRGLCDSKYDLETGLLSRDGWAIVNDTAASALDTSAGASADSFEAYFRSSWVDSAPRIDGNQDMYLFGCGVAFRECLSDFTALAGPVALPPMPALGVWWSRHWGDMSGNAKMISSVGVMSEENLQKQVLDGYASRDLPLHVVVLDMEWHEQRVAPDCSKFAGIKTWGGYSWNTTLFPDPQRFVEMSLRNVSRFGPYGAQLALNYHPDYGIDACQSNYAKFGATLGLDTSEQQTLPDIDGAMASNQTYVDAYFDLMVTPSLADYAWTDTPKATTWTNDLYVRYKESESRQKSQSGKNGKKKRRGVNFSRYGGLGNHRTPVGFSGDTLRKWTTLQYEIFMTPRASNVGFGWWSHDIGGFSAGWVDDDWHTEDPELFLRWLQFASFAPVFRTHCRYCDQRIWTWGKYDNRSGVPGGWFALMRDTMYLRNALVPYIYTHASLRTHASGESLLTPLYWDPTAAALKDGSAFSDDAQKSYFFGRDFLVAPVATQCTGEPCASAKTVWLPPTEDNSAWVMWGRWNESAIKGPATLGPRGYGLAEMPVFVKAGRAIPTRDMDSAYVPVADPLIWVVTPGADKGMGDVYEDDGVTTDYRKGMGARTTVDFMWSDGGAKWSASVSAANGTFDGAPDKRAQRFVLAGRSSLPKSAKCDATALQPKPDQKGPGFWLSRDASPDTAPGDDRQSLVISCPGWAMNTAHTAEVQF